MRQCNRASRTSQGPEKNLKIVRPQCLDGIATTDKVKMAIANSFVPWKHGHNSQCRNRIVACPALLFITDKLFILLNPIIAFIPLYTWELFMFITANSSFPSDLYSITGHNGPCRTSGTVLMIPYWNLFVYLISMSFVIISTRRAVELSHCPLSH